MSHRRDPVPVRPDRGLPAVAVVAGVLALAAAVVGVTVPGLAPLAAPEPAWGLHWNPDAVGADAVAAAAVSHRVRLAAALVGVVAGSALLTLLFVLLGGRERRRPGLAVRSALGAGTPRLMGHIVGLARRRAVMVVVGGSTAGAVLAGLLRWSWPGAGIAGAAEPATAWIRVAAGVAGGVVAVSGVLGAGLLSPLAGLGIRAPTLLRRGPGVTDDPRAGTVRRGVATLQVGLSLALAVTGLALLPAGASVSAAGGAAAGPAVGRWAVEGARTLDPDALLASPGAWVGAGVRDRVTVDCGACTRGVWYLPVYAVDSTVHAVTPAALEALGVEVVEGRAFGRADGAGTEPVGVVNVAFRRHFEGRHPVGRRIRLPGPGDRWLRVVGVVDDPDFAGPGAPSPGDPVLWVPLAQHPVTVVEGSPGASAGLRPLAAARPLAELRRDSRAPLTWAGRLLAVGGLLAVLLALVSAAEVARVEVVGRSRASAIRLALGAPPRGPAGALLRRTMTTAGMGIGVGLAVAGSLERALGAEGDGTVRWVLGAAVLVATVVGALPRCRDLMHLHPAALLRSE